MRRQRPGPVRRYRSDSPQGLCLGSFAVLELLRHQPLRARRVVISPALESERMKPLAERCRHHSIELVEDRQVLRRVAHRKDVDAMAIFDKYRERLAAEADHVVLVRPANPGNLGAIMRTMAGLGARDLALIGDADPFNPHVVRSSLGARFQIRAENFASLHDYRERRRSSLHLFTGDGGRSLPDIDFPSPFTLVFGPEWPGLQPEELSLGTPVTIPLETTVESLNLAVAVGIALYAARR